jgi:hypothetical protein
MSTKPRVPLEQPQLAALERLGRALIDQQAARILVEPLQRAPGFWFGGGNILRDADGSLLITGRHRVFGDSRTGLDLGERGAQLAIYRAATFDGPFERILTLSKADVAPAGDRVISIEGACLHAGTDGVELFVSSEKERAYPEPVRQYQKADTGVWSIDVLRGPTLNALGQAAAEPILLSNELSHLHVEDPKVWTTADGSTAMLFCSHPYTWSSSNTGLAIRPADNDTFSIVNYGVLERGPVWDVAVTRITDRLPVPRLGRFAALPDISLYFYDGAECVRQLPENAQAVRRPRGYSCEEIGGLAWGSDAEFPLIQRLSVDTPLFISPHGTGCSRYVATLVTDDAIYATWQQGQADGSQPLCGHRVSMEEIEAILSQ